MHSVANRMETSSSVVVCPLPFGGEEQKLPAGSPPARHSAPFSSTFLALCLPPGPQQALRKGLIRERGSDLLLLYPSNCLGFKSKHSMKLNGEACTDRESSGVERWLHVCYMVIAMRQRDRANETKDAEE